MEFRVKVRDPITQELRVLKIEAENKQAAAQLAREMLLDSDRIKHNSDKIEQDMMTVIFKGNLPDLIIENNADYYNAFKSYVAIGSPVGGYARLTDNANNLVTDFKKVATLIMGQCPKENCGDGFLRLIVKFEDKTDVKEFYISDQHGEYSHDRPDISFERFLNSKLLRQPTISYNLHEEYGFIIDMRNLEYIQVCPMTLG